MSKEHGNDVFLSYSSKDRPWVSEFVTTLRNKGVQAWFDVHDLAPGDLWQEKLQNALRDSRFLIIMLSANNVESPWMFFEFGASMADQKHIIPILLGDLEPSRIPLSLRRFQLLKDVSAVEAGKRIAEVTAQSLHSDP